MVLQNTSIFCLGWLLPSPFSPVKKYLRFLGNSTFLAKVKTNSCNCKCQEPSLKDSCNCMRHEAGMALIFPLGFPFVASVRQVDFECTWLPLVSLLATNVTLLCRSFSSRSHASQKSVAGLSQTRPNLDGANNG